MTKVTLNEEPAAEASAPADAPTKRKLDKNDKGEVKLEAPSGRIYTFKRYQLLEQFWFFDAMGAQSAANPSFCMLALPLLWVKAIDGEPVPPVKTRLQLESLIQKVGYGDFGFVDEIADAMAAEEMPEDPGATLKN